MPLLPLFAIAAGLVVLVWSADRFVAGAAALARHFGMSPLLIGMLIVGFGTSAPEMLVSALASWQGSPGIALGNAFGSNIANIALILGLTALVCPIAVHSTVLRRELPILLGVTVLAVVLVANLILSRLDALILLGVFAGLVFWSIRQSRREGADNLGKEIETEGRAQELSLLPAVLWTAAGLLLLILSSRALVWGAVETAQFLGVSDLIIGLTVVSVGTSLPELASSLVAIRRNEHDIALGNVIGSNLFNTLVVVGIAGAVSQLEVPAEVLYRDLPVMGALTLALVAACAGFGRPGRVNRLEGAALLAVFVAYTGYLVLTAGL
jgi:cation:H+ antiporter